MSKTISVRDSFMGLAVGLIVGAGMVFTYYNDNPPTSRLERPAYNVFKATGMTKDGIVIPVSVTTVYPMNIFEKKELDNEARYFLRNVVGRFKYEQKEQMAKMIYDSTTKFLGLPCNASVSNVNVGPPQK